MLLSDIKEIENGRGVTKDGGIGSGVKGHFTAKQMAAMKERQGLRKKDPKKGKWAGGVTHKGEGKVEEFISEHPFVKSLTPKFKKEMEVKGFTVSYRGEDVVVETPSGIYFSEREDK